MLEFTAEVDVRPEIELPDVAGSRQRRRRRADRRRDRRAARRAARPLRHADRRRARRPRPATSSPSTCRPPSTARTSTTPPPPACPTRSAPASSIDGIDDALIGAVRRRDQDLHHPAGRRRARRPGRRGHRHRRSRSSSASCPRPTTSSPSWPASSTPLDELKADLRERIGRVKKHAAGRRRPATRCSRRCSRPPRCRSRRRCVEAEVEQPQARRDAPVRATTRPPARRRLEAAGPRPARSSTPRCASRGGEGGRTQLLLDTIADAEEVVGQRRRAHRADHLPGPALRHQPGRVRPAGPAVRPARRDLRRRAPRQGAGRGVVREATVTDAAGAERRPDAICSAATEEAADRGRRAEDDEAADETEKTSPLTSDAVSERAAGVGHVRRRPTFVRVGDEHPARSDHAVRQHRDLTRGRQHVTQPPTPERCGPAPPD